MFGFFKKKKQINKNNISTLNEFEHNNYPDRNTIEKLSKEINMHFKQIYDWFRNKKSKLNIKKRTRSAMNSQVILVLLKEFKINKYRQIIVYVND
jgi:hypothetical protein